MKKYQYLFMTLCFLMITCTGLWAQEKGDYVWISGTFSGTLYFEDTTTAYNDDSTYLYYGGGSELNFNYAPVKKAYRVPFRVMDLTNTCISDEEGNLVFYSNGLSVYNAAGDLIENGDSLTHMPEWMPPNSGINISQMAISMKQPGQEDIYYLFSIAIKRVPFSHPYSPLFPYQFHYAIIDMKANNGAGKVIAKHQKVIEDSLDVECLTACRHANGRDWWILVPEIDGDAFYTVLFDDKGVHVINKQEPVQGVPIPQAVGGAAFSPDGKTFAYSHFNGASPPYDGGYLDIYDFNRCTGALTIKERHYFSETNGGGALVFSPNSRFLYRLNGVFITQYDLWTDSIVNSAIQLDTWETGTAIPGLAYFNFGGITPEGQILGASGSVVSHWSVMHHPNRKGAACELDLHSFELPAIVGNLPNFPHFRLGPIDGSSCDTLGIDNLPVAKFRAEPATDAPTVWEFIDLSYYNPEEWLWDFGDGQTSTEQFPLHSYAAPGWYEVCLTVSNANASDTWCDSIYVDVVSSTASVEEEMPGLRLFPNPAGQWVQVQYPAPATRLEVVDLLGRPHFSQELSGEATSAYRLGVADWPAGWYVVQVWKGDERLGQEKLLVTK